MEHVQGRKSCCEMITPREPLHWCKRFCEGLQAGPVAIDKFGNVLLSPVERSQTTNFTG